MLLNDGWSVRKPTGPFAALTGESATPRAVRLPHDVLRDVERTPDAPLGASSGYFPSSAWTYERLLDVPESWRGRWVALEFDGAASNARVYVNGALAATRPYGYSRFFVEVGPHLMFGASNDLRVELRSHKDSRWYAGAGLYRDVHLLVADALHIAGDGVSVSTPSVEDALAIVEVCTELRNDTNVMRTVRVTTVVEDAVGAARASVESPASVRPGETLVVRQRLYVSRPERWGVESPALYAASVRVTEGEATLDARSVRFGIRTVQVDPFHGLRLNGVLVKLRGACIHSDNGPLGAVSMLDAERRRARKLREAGFNAIRVAHNPASQALLDACDEVGLLVMNEAFDMWTQEKSEFDYSLHFPEWWERDVEAMVRGSRNHPSVIMYSIGNEILELGLPSGANLNRRMAEWLRGLDDTRPITNGINSLLAIDLKRLLGAAGGLNAFMGGGQQGQDPNPSNGGSAIAAGMNRIAASAFVSSAIEETCSALDVTGYNYADARYAVDASEHPERVIVGAETFPTAIAANWALVTQYPQVIGDFTWTGWDYLGEAGIGGHAYAEDADTTAAFAREFPYLLAYCGDIDITGFRRPASYYRETVFGLRRDPYIAVQRPEHHDHTPVAVNAWAWSDSVHSWTWTGFEGKPIVVEVYADADEIELRLDGAVLERMPIGGSKANTAIFHTTFTPGVLEAIAFRAGSEIGRDVLATAGTVSAVRLTAERFSETVAPDSLVFVEIELVDDQGVLVTCEDRAVTVSIEGPAELVAFGSAQPKTLERFDATTRTTFDGRALAVVRPTDVGAITISASVEGLRPAAELLSDLVPELPPRADDAAADETAPVALGDRPVAV